MSSQPLDPTNNEAVPLLEQKDQSVYTPRPEVEALTPRTPEVFAVDPVPPPAPAPESFAGETPVTSSATAPLASVSVKTDGVGGMIIAPEGGVVDQITLRSLADPFETPSASRTPSRDLFKPDANEKPPDGTLLQQFVTTQRMRDLWHQIDALQEEVIQRVHADRTDTDAYQQDLLYASSLLMQSPANYDEARQIVYRVRGDLNRDVRVLADIRRYRPIIVLYYVIWLVVIFVASRFDAQFRQMIPDNLPILKLALLPILFATGGALFNGIMALIDHTTRKRDFDPIYNTWYFVNPLIGGVLGLVVFVFFVVTGTSFNPNLINDQSLASAQTPLTIWLLAFIVGWQQNTAVKLLNGFLKTVSPEKPTAQAERPSLTDSAGKP